MRCVIGDDLRCRHCRRSASSVRVIRNCRVGKQLGDQVADVLASIGITKELVAATLGVSDCGCQRRQEALNRAGLWLGIGTPPPPVSGPTG